MIVPMFAIKCDWCNKEEVDEFENAEDARECMKEVQGWSAIETPDRIKDICPECRKKHTKQLNNMCNSNSG